MEMKEIMCSQILVHLKNLLYLQNCCTKPSSNKTRITISIMNTIIYTNKNWQMLSSLGHAVYANTTIATTTNHFQ